MTEDKDSLTLSGKIIVAGAGALSLLLFAVGLFLSVVSSIYMLGGGTDAAVTFSQLSVAAYVLAIIGSLILARLFYIRARSGEHPLYYFGLGSLLTAVVAELIVLGVTLSGSMI